MEKVELTVESTVKELIKQRCEFSKQLEAGDSTVSVGIEFIDNMLGQMVPGYVPPSGCGCGCNDK